ncbi:MAG: outer membrane lipoprotein carrier protein LolA [Piscinibacter sp.]|uniref:LolA-related protein n=1 Tax=Piscinibacter sp. TaxID=1903157 RepID=UPI0025826B56|nr:LolA-related protein [Piscinibacter sp.]MCW5664880.1 outer membrane lipoprotein carrier protein LolA [Piscinibacter sp.]
MRPERRRLLAALLLLLPAAAPAAAFDLDALMALLARRSGGEARFTEERFVAGLDGPPLRSRGTLSFTAPDRFARYTTEPRAESMEVQGDIAVLRRGGRTRQVALDALPELGALADAMRGTLTGDARTLQRHFQPGVSGSADKWTLALRPLDAGLAAQVRVLEIAGSGADVRSVEIRLANGDRSLMLVDPLTPAPR